jgi:hypothetical protein
MTKAAPATVDILISNEGSIFMFYPQTDEGREWLEEHTDGTWFGGRLAVEGRYVRDLAEGILEDGLSVE